MMPDTKKPAARRASGTDVTEGLFSSGSPRRFPSGHGLPCRFPTGGFPSCGLFPYRRLSDSFSPGSGSTHGSSSPGCGPLGRGYSASALSQAERARFCLYGRDRPPKHLGDLCGRPCLIGALQQRRLFGSPGLGSFTHPSRHHWFSTRGSLSCSTHCLTLLMERVNSYIAVTHLLFFTFLHMQIVHLILVRYSQ